MRMPTQKERFVLRTVVASILEDMKAINAQGTEFTPEVPYKDILGTFGTNIEVLSRIHKKLCNEEEREGT